MPYDDQTTSTPTADGDEEGPRDETETLSTTLPDDVEKSACDLLDAAQRAELGLATAESCTGGLLASVLTDVEGKSSVFERGFVVYSQKAKCQVLNLDEKMVEDCGVVSEEVARALAEAAVDLSDAKLAVGITGFAGPAGEDDEEGLVHLAVHREGGDTFHREMHYGAIGRGGIRIAAVRTAIEMMRAAI